jgi:hypothetical protein
VRLERLAKVNKNSAISNNYKEPLQDSPLPKPCFFLLLANLAIHEQGKHE